MFLLFFSANLPNIAEKKKTKSLFFIKGTKVWKFGKNDAPFFDEATFEIAKYATFQVNNLQHNTASENKINVIQGFNIV